MRSLTPATTARMTRFGHTLTRWLAFLLVVCIWGWAGCDVCHSGLIPRQPHIPVIKNWFNFKSGAWASYIVFDKRKFTYSYLDVAIGQHFDCSKPYGCYWVEFRLRNQAAPATVTRVLVEETDDGPGEIKKGVIWLKGYRPFCLPQAFLKGTQARIPLFKPQEPFKTISVRRGLLRGKQVTISQMVNLPESQPTLAYLAKEVMPLGIVILETPRMGMYLQDWGYDHNDSWIAQPVISFENWIESRLGEAIKEAD